MAVFSQDTHINFTRVLNIIVRDSAKSAQHAVNAGAIEILVSLICPNNLEIATSAVLTLGIIFRKISRSLMIQNSLGHREQFRDKCIKAGLVNKLHALIAERFDDLPVIPLNNIAMTLVMLCSHETENFDDILSESIYDIIWKLLSHSNTVVVCNALLTLGHFSYRNDFIEEKAKSEVGF
jgi:hypothetical protein